MTRNDFLEKYGNDLFEFHSFVNGTCTYTNGEFLLNVGRYETKTNDMWFNSKMTPNKLLEVYNSDYATAVRIIDHREIIYLDPRYETAVRDVPN